MIKPFLDRVYEYTEKEEIDVLIDYIFYVIDEWLCEGKFELVDEVLVFVETSRLEVNGMLSFLTITHAAQSKLKNRIWFYNKVYSILLKSEGRYRTKRLLHGFMKEEEYGNSNL
jgi:hypothetical protein